MPRLTRKQPEVSTEPERRLGTSPSGVRGTPEEPYYFKVEQRPDQGTQLYMIICDEGWRSVVVCNNMYESVADWLIDHIQGKPFKV